MYKCSTSRNKILLFESICSSPENTRFERKKYATTNNKLQTSRSQRNLKPCINGYNTHIMYIHRLCD